MKYMQLVSITDQISVKINEIIDNMITNNRIKSLAKKYNLNYLYNIEVKTNKKSDISYIMSKGEQIIGIEDNSPPFMMINGKKIGFNIKFTTKIYSRLDIYMIFKNIDLDKKETELNDKNSKNLKFIQNSNKLIGLRKKEN